MFVAENFQVNVPTCSNMFQAQRSIRSISEIGLRGQCLPRLITSSTGFDRRHAGVPIRCRGACSKMLRTKNAKIKRKPSKTCENRTWTWNKGCQMDGKGWHSATYIGFKHYPSRGRWYHLNISQPSFSSKCFRAWLCQARQNAQATSLDLAHVLSICGMQKLLLIFMQGTLETAAAISA